MLNEVNKGYDILFTAVNAVFHMTLTYCLLLYCSWMNNTDHCYRPTVWLYPTTNML